MIRGTPKWAFNLIREDCLSAFVRDLEALEAHGLIPPKGRCEAVQLYLKQASKIMNAIPASSASGKSVSVDFEEFADRYLNWNNPVGHDPLTRRMRAEAHARLKKQRKRISDRARNTLPKISDDSISWPMIDDLYRALHGLVTDNLLQGVFTSLARSLKDFDHSTIPYRQRI